MREAWSEQKERKARKEDRKDKREKRKAAEWAAKDHEPVGPVEEFRRAKKAKGDGGYDDEEAEDGGGFDFEYKTMKREVKEERAAKKGRKEKVTAGMFDGLD
jgi:ATP-dependent RNA helicase DDX55/SPB4